MNAHPPNPNAGTSLIARAKIALTFSLCIALCGCGSDAKQGNDNGQVESSKTVQIALNWFPDAQHGGFYGAQVFGLLEASGLQADLLPGGPGAPVVQNVAMRRNDFGVANADQILMARAQGAPVVAIMAAMQTSPRCIMLHESSDIKSFEQLANVKLALGTGKAFASFLRKELPLTNVTIVPYNGSIAPFLADAELAQQAYVFSEPNLVKQQGIAAVTLLVSDLGFNPYTSCLFTHEAMIRESPDKVRRVVDAVRAGWLNYFKSPGPVHEAILKDNPKVDQASLDYAVNALEPLCLPSTLDPIKFGHMTAERWQTLSKQLIKLDLLPQGYGLASGVRQSILVGPDTTTH